MLRKRDVFSKHILVVFALMVNAPVYASGPVGGAIQGTLFAPGGAAVTSNSVDFRVQVLDKTGACVLYEESHDNVDLSLTSGDFSFNLGSGTARANRVDNSGDLKANVFRNDVNPPSVTGCGVAPTFAAGDERMIRVQFDLGSGFVTLTPDMTLKGSVYSTVAETLGGKGAGEFVQVRDDATYDLNQTNVETIFSAVNFAKLVQILSGNFGGTTVTNVGTPSAGTDATNKNYVDANIGGKIADVTAVGPAAGNGHTLIWDMAQNRWVTGVPSATDNTKLPLAGGTMTGAIAMGGQNITNIGHMTMATQRTLNLGTYTNAQETTLVAGLGAADEGKIWFNSEDNLFKVWNGSAAVSTFAPSGAAGGDLTGTYPNPTLANGVVATAELANDAVTSAKINNTGIAVNRLLITDATTGANVTYKTCALDESLKWTASGWACTTAAAFIGNTGVTAATYGNATQVSQVQIDAQGRIVTASNVNIAFPVVSVAGKTGAVTLNIADVSGLGTAAAKDYGTAAGNLVELDGGGKIPASLLPSTSGDIQDVIAGSGLTGGGSSGSVTLNVDTGTTANKIVQLDASAYLPAVDGRNLTNINAVQLQTRNVAATAPTAAQVLTWNASASAWEPQTLPAGNTGDITSVTASTGLTGGAANGDATLAVDVGTTANKIVQLDASAYLPAVDGRNLTNINAVQLQTRNVSATAPTASQVLAWNAANSTWEPKTESDAFVGTVTSVVGGAGLLGGNITSTGTLSIDVGTTAGKIVQLDASAYLPAVDGRNLTNINAVQLQTRNVAATAPTAAQVLTWNASASAWEPQDLPAVVNTGFVNGGNSFGVAAVLGTNDNNSLAFETNGVTAMTLGTDGRLGIGTASPGAPLEVSGSATNLINLYRPANSGSASMNFYLNNATPAKFEYGRATVAIDDDAAASEDASYTISLARNGSLQNRFNIEYNGNIGFGTTAPAYELTFGGANGDKTIGVERNANVGPGLSMTLQAGQPRTVDADTNGGTLYLNGGPSTGTGTSKIEMRTATAGGAGTTDNSPTTKMTILGNGNVGIGTTTPGSLLTVEGPVALDNLGADPAGVAGYGSLYTKADGKLYYRDGTGSIKDLSATGGGSVTGITAGPGLTGGTISVNGTIGLDTNVILDGGNNTGSAITIGNNHNSALHLEANGATAMTILPTGNVGIGVTNPSAAFQIASTLPIAYDRYGATSHFNQRRANGTVGTPTAVVSGDELARLNASGYDGSAYSTGGASVRMYAEENFDGTHNGTSLRFYNTPLVSTTQTERMRIAANGNVGIGDSNPSSKLSVAGSGAFTGELSAGSTGVDGVITFNRALDGVGTSKIANYGNEMQIQNSMFNSYITFQTNNAGTTAERVRIMNDGKVGIGTTSANALLTVEGATSLRQQGSDPAGAANYGTLFTKTDGKLYYRDGTGSIKDLSATGNGSVTSVVAGSGLTGGNITATGTITVDTGTTANKIVQLDASAYLPAVDGRNLTNINAVQLQTRNVAATAPTAAQVLTWNASASAWEPQTLPAGNTGDITSVTASTGLTGGAASGDATLAVDVGTTANKIVQLDASAYLPAVDGRNLTNVNAVQLQTRNVSSTAPTAAQVLAWNAANSTWEPKTESDAFVGTVTSVVGGAGLLGGNITSTGTLAIDVGTTAGKIVQLDASAYLPAVDGRNLTNINAVQLQTRNIAATAPTAAQVLTWNASASAWEPQTLPTGNVGDITSVSAGTGLTGGGTSGDATLSVDVGTTANKIVQLDASAYLPAVDGRNLTNVNAVQLQARNVSSTAPTAGQVLTWNAGNSTWEATAPAASANSFIQNGNSFGALATLGTNDAQSLAFEAGGTEAIRILTSGNVGIGTTTPAYRIDTSVSGAGTVGALRLQNSVSAATDSGSSMIFSSNRTTGGMTNVASLSGVITDIADATPKGAMVFSTNWNGALAERMRLGYSGALLLGNGSSTQSQGGLLNVIDDSSSTTQLYLRNYRNTAVDPPTMKYYKDRAGNNISAADLIAQTQFNARNNGADTAFVAEVVTASNVGAGIHKGSYSLQVADAGTIADRLTINGSNVGIGTNSPNALLTVEGAMTLDQLAADPAGTAGYGSVYVKNDGKLYYRDGTGTITDLSAAGGSPAADSLDFTHFADAMTLDASTTITSSGTNALSLINTGTGNSFTVMDQAGDTTPFVIKDDGNVGVGVASPLYSLDVRTPAAATQIHFSSTGNDDGGYLFGYNANTAYFSAGAAYNGTNWIAKSTKASLLAQENGNVFIYSNSGLTSGNSFTPTPVALIGDSHAGFGTGSNVNPAGNLEVASYVGGDVRGIVSTQNASNFTEARFIAQKSRGAYGAETAVVNSDSIGSFVASPHDGTGYIQTASIGFLVNGAVATNSVPTDFLINTGVTGAGSERVRVTSTGNVGIGTASPNAKLTVEGAMTLDQLAADPAGSAGYGSVYVKTDGKLYYRDGTGTISDLTAGAGAATLSSLGAATATNTINNLNFAQTWNWNSLSSQTALSMGTTTGTTGSLLSLTNSNNSATSVGPISTITATGSSNRAIGQLITHAGTNVNATGISLNMSANAVTDAGTAIKVQHEAGQGIGASIVMNNNDSTSASTGVKVTSNGAQALGADISLTSNDASSAGKGVRITQANRHANARGIDVSMTDATGAGTGISVSHSGTGDGISSSVASGRAGYFSSATGYGLIVNSGNVGIGTNTPTNRLDVRASDESTTVNVRNNDSTVSRYPGVNATNYMGTPNTGSPTITLRNYRGNSTTSAALASSDILGRIMFYGGYDASSSSFEGARIQSNAEQAFSGAAAGSNIRFYTTSLNATSATEKVRLTADGDLAIGTTSANSKLTVEGAMSLDQLAADPTGTAGYGSVYTKTDGKLYYRDGTGTITDLTSGGGDFLRNGTLAMTGNFQTGGQWISNDGGSEGIWIHADGRVGIGTSSPQTPLHLASVVDGGPVIMRIDNTQPAVATSVDESSQLQFLFNGVAAGHVRVEKEEDFTVGANQSSFMSFSNVRDGAVNENVRITAAGNVGIGTTAPTGKLHTFSSSATSNIFEVRSDTNMPQLDLLRNRDNAGANEVLLSGDVLGNLNFRGYNGTAPSTGAVISALAAENWSGGSRGGILTFSTTQIGASTTNERMRIDANGRVAIGTTTANAPLTLEGAMSLDQLAADHAGAAGYGSLYTKTDGKLYYRDGTGTISDISSGNALQLQGRAVASTAPTASQVLAWNAASSQWQPMTAAGGSDNLGNHTATTNITLAAGETISNSGSSVFLNGVNQIEIDLGNGSGYPHIWGSGNAVAFDSNLEVHGGFGFSVYDNGNDRSAYFEVLDNSNTVIGNSAGSIALLPTSGNVGIGTTNPVVPLQIDSAASSFAIASFTSDATGHAATDGFVIGYDSGSGNAMIWNNEYTPVKFATNDQERMIIDQDGNVGIGTSTPEEVLHVAGNVKATSFISTSDQRLKTDIRPSPGLEAITKLNGYQYKWKSSGEDDAGVLAQEVEQVFPDAVRTEKKSGMKGVKYQYLIAPLIEATKELNNKCEMSQQQIAELQARVETMSREIQSLRDENRDLKNILIKMNERLEKLEQQKQ